MRIQRWNLVFLIGFVVYVCIRGVFNQRTKNNEKTVSRVDALEKTLIAIVILGGLLLPVVYLFTPWLAFADYHLPAFAPWCGMVLMVMALWLFWRSHADLGQNWSVTLELRKGHQLVKGQIAIAIQLHQFGGNRTQPEALPHHRTPPGSEPHTQARCCRLPSLLALRCRTSSR